MPASLLRELCRVFASGGAVQTGFDVGPRAQCLVPGSDAWEIKARFFSRGQKQELHAVLGLGQTANLDLEIPTARPK